MPAKITSFPLYLQEWWGDERSISEVKTHDPTAIWQCPKGHKFQARIENFARKTRCGICIRIDKDSKITRYARNYRCKIGKPHTKELNIVLIQQWASLRSPSNTFANDKSAKWKCEKGHFWRESMDARRILNWNGKDYSKHCPVCYPRSGRYAKLNIAPALLQFYADRRNISELSNKERVIWKCPEGHLTKATIANRISEYNKYKRMACLICADRSFIVQFRQEAPDIFANMVESVPFAAAILDAIGYLNGAKGRLYREALRLRSQGLSTSAIIAQLAPEDSELAPNAMPNSAPDAGVDIDLKPSAGTSAYTSPASAQTPLPIIPWEQKHVSTLGKLVEIDKLLHAKEGLCESAAYQFFIDCMVGELWASYCWLEDIGEDLTSFVQPIVDRTSSDSRLLRTVAQTFMRQFKGALALFIPQGFRPVSSSGKPIKLRMMQRLPAWHLAEGGRQRFGNWSAPGAGKTLGALFAARVLGSRLTVVLCPNHVIPTWHAEVERTYNHNKRLNVVLEAKTWTPAAETDILVINYDQLQGRGASEAISDFVKTYGALVGLVVLDECHRTKNNGKIGQAAESSRRKVVEELLGALPDAKVLIQTGTPILTNCAEGSSLLNLLDPGTVEQYKLTGRDSFMECVRLHCAFSRHGVRFKPSIRDSSGSEIRLHEPSIKTHTDGRFCRTKGAGLDLVDPHGMARLTEVPGHVFDGLIGKSLNWCEYDELATPHKISSIVAALRPGTVIYSEYVAEGRANPIVLSLAAAVIAAGFSVAVYDGGAEGAKGHDARLLNDCKCKRCCGLRGFKTGKVDVLVASRILGEGVDGLQGVASRLIVSSPPWTDGSWDQLVGRLYRAGQSKTVEVIVPVLWFRTAQGGDTSLDMLRLARIAERGSIADAVLDGQFPTHSGGSQELIRRAKEELAKLSEGDPGEQAEIQRFEALAKP